MKSLIITALLFLTGVTGASAQENTKTFTAEERAIVELSNNRWQLSTLAFTNNFV